MRNIYVTMQEPCRVRTLHSTSFLIRCMIVYYYYFLVSRLQVARRGSLAIGTDASLSVNVSQIYAYVVTLNTTGQVLYRQSNSSSELTRTAATIQSAFTSSGTFTPSFLFISTWLSIGVNSSQNVVRHRHTLILIYTFKTDNIMSTYWCCTNFGTNRF